jgi:branched-subunit amino acid aminotransferase/4-amino-4-deoxychorismate lyase
MDEPLAYFNGQIIAASQARLAIYDAGFVLGATITEQTRTFGHRPWRLADHLHRLLRSLEAARMDVDLSKEQWISISKELIEHNARFVHQRDELGLIQFVTPGEYPTYAGMAAAGGARSAGFSLSPDGLKPALRSAAPTVCIHTFPLPFEVWAERMRRGAHLVTPPVRHMPPECCDPAIKHRSRFHYYLADQQARLVDPQASALLLDLAGNVTETSTANFLMVEKGTIVSPTMRNILPGISRQVVIELATRLGIPFAQRDFPIEAAMKAQEALLTSTPYCLMAVTQINGTMLSDGRPGPIFHRLLTAWSQEVGLDIACQIEEGAQRRSVG